MGKRKLTIILVLCTAFLFGIGGVIRASFKSNSIVETRATTDDPVTYIERSWNGNSVVEEVKTCTEYTEIKGKVETLSSGWYVVKKDMTTFNDKRITCTGTVNLILSDNAVFRMTKGISTTGATLNIYGQENNSGLLHISNCDEGCSAIGGAKDNSGGTFNVHGGSIWAHGGFYAAGIGSGQNTTSNTIRSGEVTIYGGTVYTETYSYGAGIGGGEKKGSGNIIIDPVKIYGGNVTALGSYNAYGIGGGKGCTNNGQLTVASGLNVLKLVYNKAPEIIANYATTRYERMRICAPISYVSRSWDDTNKVVVESTVNCISYTNATAFQEEYMSNDTYVVDSNFTTTNDYITIYNTCNLILFDGCSWAPKKGIYVAGGSSVYGTLNIYGQSNGTGTLFAGDGKQSGVDAGLGGHGGLETGKINIFGGRIKAIGGSYSAGIGGVFYDKRTYTSGEITIYGGDVTAIGGTDNLYGRAAAGIGAGAATPGYENATPNVTIYGGNVNAIGGEYGGAGIGGGYTDGYLLSGPAGGDCGTVTILGGTVRASGGNGAKGIGTGRKGSNQGTLTVGSTLNVYGEDHKNPGVLIEKGSSGYERSQYMVIKNKEGKIDPEHIDPSLLGGGADQTLDTIDLPDLWTWKNPTALVGDGIGAEMRYTPTNTNIYNTLEKTVDISVVEPVTYIDKEWNSTSKSVVKTNKTRTSYRVVTEDMETTWMSGWYLVNSDVTFSDRIICDGTINLILGDGCTLTTTDGISVALGDAINIYSQSDGDNTGRIVSSTDGQYIRYSPLGGPNNDNTGIINIFGGEISSTCAANSDSYGAAAIGGGANANSGPITIYGGKITATGGKNGAGIGGGSIASYYGPRTVGAITIYDGEVTATGCAAAPGIGAGYCSSYYSTLSLVGSVDVEAIRIYGGNITATGGCFNDYSTGGAGIGCGYIGYGNATLYNTVTINEITINNATVTAQGGNYAAGIGGGYNRGVLNIGNITFNSSIVTASGFSYSHNDKGGAGIGSGYCYTDNNLGKVFISDITINGSTVTATGDGGPGIGLANCNTQSSIGNIHVNNSYIKAIGSTGYDAIGCATGSSQKGTLVLGDLMAVFGDDTENPTTERDASEYETNRWTYMTLMSLGQPVSLTLGSGISDGYVSTLYDGSTLDPNGTAYEEGSVVYGFVKVIEGYIPDSSWTSIGNSVYRVSDEGVTIETSPIDLGEFSATATTYNINYDLGEGATHGSTHPESATYDEVFSVSAPTRPGYVFNGWTVIDGLNTSTAKWGIDNTTGNDVSSSSTKCFAGNSGSVYFKNLNSSNGSVTLKANWLKSMSYSSSGAYSGPYNGQEHYLTFDVTDPLVGATIKFGMTQGVYDLDECPHFIHPGEYEIYYEITADGYAPVRGSIVISIDAVTLNVTVDNKVISYGDDAPTYTYTITGFISGEDESVLGGSPVFDCTYNQGDNAGEYDINLSGFTSDDYNISYTSGTLTVEELPSSIVDAPTAKEGLIYNGDEQQLLNAGSASHGHIEYSIDGEHYSATIPGATDVGTYTVYYIVVGDPNYSNTDPVSIEVTIAKASSSVVSAPTGIDGLKYTGSPQVALNGGTAEGGTMVYSLDGVNFSTEIPTVTNVGTYTIYYKVVGDNNHNDSDIQELHISIAKAQAVLTAPTAITGLHYNGEAQALVNAGSTTFGEVLYKIDDGEWSTTLPSITNVGTYTIYYKVAGTDNFDGVAEDSFTVTISENNKDALEAIITTATAYHDEKAVDYPPLDQWLQTEIDKAIAVKNNPNKTEQEINDAVDALTDYLDTIQYYHSVIKTGVDLINEIPNPISYDNQTKTKIDAANYYYINQLNETAKEAFPADIKAILDQAKDDYDAADEYVSLVNQIPNPVVYTDACKDKIDTARECYNGLTDFQKTLVDELVLIEAEADYKALDDQDKADAVKLLIENIPNPVEYTQACKDKIDAARAAYEALSAEQKVLVSNLQDLVDAEKAYEALGKIHSISDIAYDTDPEAAINKAREIYDSLSDNQKALISDADLTILTKAEGDYATIKQNAELLLIILLIVSSLTLVGGIIFLIVFLKKKREKDKEEEENNRQVKAMSIGGFIPLVILTSHYLDFPWIILYVIAGSAVIMWIINLIVVLANKKKKQASKEASKENKEKQTSSYEDDNYTLQISFDSSGYYKILREHALSYEGTSSDASEREDVISKDNNPVFRFILRRDYLIVSADLSSLNYKIVEKDNHYRVATWQISVTSDKKCEYAKELIDSLLSCHIVYEEQEEEEPLEPVKEEVVDIKEDEEGNEIVTTKDTRGHLYVTRYAKSFTARLIQADDEAKDYYEVLKNYVLGYSDVASRVSWNYDSINFGKEAILKFNIRGKTLCVYYALDVDKIGEKYKVEKSEHKKYEKVPCLYRITDDRRARLAEELIDRIMRKYKLVKDKELHENYHLPYEDRDALLSKGLIKEVKVRID